MRKLSRIASLCLALAFPLSLSLAGCELNKKKGEEKATFEKELVTLAENSRKEGTSCDKFVTEMNTLLKGLAQDLTFPEKAPALQLIAKIKEYPGHPQSTYRLIQKVATELTRESDWDTTPVTLAYTCKAQDLGPVFRVIVANDRKHKFTEEERSELRRTLIDFVLKELGGTSGLSSLIASQGLLRFLIDEEVVSVSDPIFTEINRLDQEVAEHRSEVGGRWQAAFPKGTLDPKSLKGPERIKFNAVMKHELERTDLFRSLLFRVVAHVRRNI